MNLISLFFPTWIVSALLALFVHNGIASQIPKETDKTIKIGLLIQDSKYTQARNGAEIAIRKANEKGGIKGRSFQLITRSMEGFWGTGSKEAVNLIAPQTSVGLGALASEKSATSKRPNSPTVFSI